MVTYRILTTFLKAVPSWKFGILAIKFCLGQDFKILCHTLNSTVYHITVIPPKSSLRQNEARYLVDPTRQWDLENEIHQIADWYQQIFIKSQDLMRPKGSSIRAEDITTKITEMIALDIQTFTTFKLPTASQIGRT